MAFNRDIKDKAPVLNLKSCFGIRTDIAENINFFSSDKCAYCCGNYIVICSVKDKAQHFFPANPKYGEITCFGIDEKGDFILLAIAQKGEKNLITVRVFNKTDLFSPNGFRDLREIKLSPDDLEFGDYFISLSVNLSSSQIIAYFGTKVSGVVVYYFDTKISNSQTRIIAGEKLTSKYNYKQVKINPFDPNYFAVIGEGAFAVFKFNGTDKLNKVEINQNTYTEFEKTVFNFVTFTWVTNTRLAIINYSSDVFILDYHKKFDAPLKKVYKSTDLFDSKAKAKSIFSKYNNIFIVKDDGYTLKLENKNLEGKQISYEKIVGPKFIQNMPRMEVHTVSITNPAIGGYSSLLVTTESGQIYFLDLKNDDALYEGSNFKNLIASFHSEEIVAIDVAKCKPLVVSASKDRNIKVWNYHSGFLEVFEIFEEEPVNIAFHPNGLHLAVLFRTKCKLMNVCDKSIRVYKEILIDIPFDIKFSSYGNYFSICYSSKFVIYDFYSMEIKYKIIENTHKNEVNCLTWDNNAVLCEFNFATCGTDGKAYYWDINNSEHPIYEYVNKEKKFYGVNFYKLPDTTNTNMDKFYFLIIDDNSLIEVEGSLIYKEDGKIVHTKDFEGKKDLKPIRVIVKEEYINNFFYDFESKVIITSNSKEHYPSLKVLRQYYIDSNDIISYQGNSTGVRQFKVSHNMNYMFTCGRDKCLLVYQISNIIKQDKREEVIDTDLILMEKPELDFEKENLIKKLQQIQNDIDREAEKAIREERMINEEIRENTILFEADRKRNQEIKDQLDVEIRIKKKEFADEENDKLQKNKILLNQLKQEQNISKMNKDLEEKKEEENINKTNKQHTTLEINQLKQYKTENKKVQEEYDLLIQQINLKIKEKEYEKTQLNKSLAEDKEKLMKENDDFIARKRFELEKLRNEYEKIEKEFANLKQNLTNEIDDIKVKVKTKNETKNTEKNDLSEMININDKIYKEIRELSAEKKDKENTIKEKNEIERQLFKENQELEKFKFVLNYKIKELQHEKDPKENNLQQLEKRAKDMDREIKNFEYSQRNYLIDLTTNNEHMNLKEKLIIELKKDIEKLQRYKKLFKHALYQSSLKAGNYKQLKKRIIDLKCWFLDKDFIIALEKNAEDDDYDNQREFLEENNKNNKEKIRSTQKLFTQDHYKLMRENRNLIRIVNELEREHYEISKKNINEEESDFLKNDKKRKKESIPVVSQGCSSLTTKEKQIIHELNEVEKEIVMINLKKKKLKKKKEDMIKDYVKLQKYQNNENVTKEMNKLEKKIENNKLK